MIVIGIGSGRSGTASLAKLLNAQRDAVCFHELNPSCVRFEGTPRPILNTICEFEAIASGGDPSMLTVDLSRGVSARAYDRLTKLPRVRLIGDIAFYYLAYVERILELHPRVRFVCLKRDRAETVESWLRKTEIRRWPTKLITDRIASWITREPYNRAYNYWTDHDGKVWRPDPVWDKCFPKFPAATRRSSIEQYWDFYYRTVERIMAAYPGRIHLVRTEIMNTPVEQERLLAFCGLEPDEMIFTDAHVHRSRALSAA